LGSLHIFLFLTVGTFIERCPRKGRTIGRIKVLHRIMIGGWNRWKRKGYHRINANRVEAAHVNLKGCGNLRYSTSGMLKRSIWYLSHETLLPIKLVFLSWTFLMWLNPNNIIYAQLHRLIYRTLRDQNGHQTLHKNFNIIVCSNQKSNSKL
jgi:hypothetical protein